MFVRWGHVAFKYRRVLPLAIVALIAGIYLIWGTQLGARMSQEGWDDPNSSSTRAAAIEQEVFGRDNNGDVILMFKGSPDALTDDAVARDVNKQLTAFKDAHPSEISHINSYFEKRNPNLLNADKTLAFAAVGLAGDGEDVLKNFRAIEGDIPAEVDGLEVSVAGQTAIADALDDGMAGDISRAEVYALPAVAVLLLLVFASVVAAAMPLIVGVLSILGSLGVLAILAGFTQVNVFAQSVVTLLGLGLAIDYGLFMVSRFREELDAGSSVEDAVVNATATAGKTVVFSAAMVAVALSGLLIFPQAFLKSVAYGAISAVGLAAALSIAVLPSIFGLLGRRVDMWSMPWRRKAQATNSADTTDTADLVQPGTSRLWAAIPAWAIKHSVWVTVALVGALLALTLPLAGVKFGGINETYLPPQQKVRVAQQTFDENFPEYRTEPIKLVVTGADNRGLSSIIKQANQVEGLTGRFSPSQPTKDGTTVLSAGIADRGDNAAVVDQLRAIEVPEGAEVFIGGSPALEVESIEALFKKLPWMALYIVAATFILMSLVFSSVILPAKAVIMTILGMGATLGVLTLMFVDGVGASLFGFTPGPLMSPVLVLIMAIIYGLSTDYEVFLVSRMVEARGKGKSTDDAIVYGTAHTGSIITAAAVIMIVVCGAFGFSEIVMMKYIAFGMIAALLLDATVIRMLLVPAVMHLLREDNWWGPRWLTAIGGFGHGSSVDAASLQVSKEPTVDDVQVDTRPVRSGRTTTDDPDLIPFDQLVKRLQEES